MNAQNIDNKPKVTKESKNKIRVEFERTPLKERLKAKFLSLFFTKIAGSFMAPDDFVDVTVRLIPKNFTLDTYKAIWIDQHYLQAFLSTLFLSLSTALIQTFICCLVGYGLAKFKFKGNKLVFMAVIFSLVVPHQTLQLSMFMNFRYFDIFGIGNFLNGGGINFFGKNFCPEFMKSIDIMGNKIAEEGLEQSDLVLTVPTDRAGLFDIEKLDKCYKFGYDTVIQNLHRIRSILN